VMTIMHDKAKLDKYLKIYYVGEYEKGSDAITKAFLEMNEELKREGAYITDFSFYQIQLARVVLLIGSSIMMILKAYNYPETSMGYYLLAATLMAMGWQQMAFIAHDAGHSSILASLNGNHLLGTFLGNCFGGISIGWWKDSHYVHHALTNDPSHDPDIQHFPFMAITEKFFASVYSTYYCRTIPYDSLAKIMIPFQHFMYYPYLLLGRFNLYANTFSFLLGNKRAAFSRIELVAICIFWAWFGTLMTYMPLGKVAIFILVSHALTFILHVQITLSHFAMSTDPRKENESFIAYQLRTTMDVDCPLWMDWFHGGLQFQAIHHLFPRLPRHNLRWARGRVIEFCKQHGIEYKCVGFLEGNLMVLDQLRTVALKVNK